MYAPPPPFLPLCLNLFLLAAYFAVVEFSFSGSSAASDYGTLGFGSLIKGSLRQRSSHEIGIMSHE